MDIFALIKGSWDAGSWLADVTREKIDLKSYSVHNTSNSDQLITLCLGSPSDISRSWSLGWFPVRADQVLGMTIPVPRRHGILAGIWATASAYSAAPFGAGGYNFYAAFGGSSNFLIKQPRTNNPQLRRGTGKLEVVSGHMNLVNGDFKFTIR